MAFWADDRNLDLEQRRLDAEQRRAAGALATRAPLPGSLDERLIRENAGQGCKCARCTAWRAAEESR